MDQAVLDFPPAMAGARQQPGPAGVVDHVGFEIGWDHARHGLVPPLVLLQQAEVLAQGWQAGRAVLGRKTVAPPRHVRLWLALRTEAWLQGTPVLPSQLGPAAVRAIETTHCPVLRVPLGGAPGQPHAATVQRLNPSLACLPGNLLMLSRAAAEQASRKDVVQAALLARESAHTGQTIEGLDAAAWGRLAALRALATPLPYIEALRLPAVLTPASNLEPVNEAQGLQLLISRWFLQAGWSTATRQLATATGQTAARHDFNLFVGALVARVLETPAGTPARRQAVEDAWLDSRVQRRWQHFMLGLGEAGARALLARARLSASAAPGRRDAVAPQGLRCWARKASIRR